MHAFAFLFPGQGSQAVGMLDAWGEHPVVAETLREASDALGEDVGALIHDGRAEYDAILLDVDNGPDGLVRDDNGSLYAKRGLAEARDALRPGGILAVWSAGPDPKFTRRLGAAGFSVEEVVVRARANGKGPRHIIWFATKQS